MSNSQIELSLLPDGGAWQQTDIFPILRGVNTGSPTPTGTPYSLRAGSLPSFYVPQAPLLQGTITGLGSIFLSASLKIEAEILSVVFGTMTGTVADGGLLATAQASAVAAQNAEITGGSVNQSTHLLTLNRYDGGTVAVAGSVQGPVGPQGLPGSTGASGASQSLGALIGTWNPATNTSPSLSANGTGGGTGASGEYFIVTTQSNTPTLDGFAPNRTNWQVNDVVVRAGAAGSGHWIQLPYYQSPVIQPEAFYIPGIKGAVQSITLSIAGQAIAYRDSTNTSYVWNQVLSAWDEIMPRSQVGTTIAPELYFVPGVGAVPDIDLDVNGFAVGYKNYNNTSYVWNQNLSAWDQVLQISQATSIVEPYNVYVPGLGRVFNVTLGLDNKPINFYVGRQAYFQNAAGTPDLVVTATQLATSFVPYTVYVPGYGAANDVTLGSDGKPLTFYAAGIEYGQSPSGAPDPILTKSQLGTLLVSNTAYQVYIPGYGAVEQTTIGTDGKPVSFVSNYVAYGQSPVGVPDAVITYSELPTAFATQSYAPGVATPLPSVGQSSSGKALNSVDQAGQGWFADRTGINRRASVISDRSFYDAAVYGGNIEGLCYALKMVHEGYTVAVIEPSYDLGGITRGGLCWADIPTDPTCLNDLALSDFYGAIRNKYSTNTPNVQLQAFEPHVVEQVVGDIVRRITKGGGKVVKNSPINGPRDVLVSNNKVQAVTANGDTISADVWHDASYTVDLGRWAGVPLVKTRESSAAYSETYGGYAPTGYSGAIGITSVTGLANITGYPAINWNAFPFSVTAPPYTTGQADTISTQAMNYRLVVTPSVVNGSANPNYIPWPKPPNYPTSPAGVGQKWGAIVSYWVAKNTTTFFGAVGNQGLLPNNKIQTNTGAGTFPDFSGFYTNGAGSYDYASANWSLRRQIEQQYIEDQAGLMWMAANDPIMVAAGLQALQASFASYGLCADEFQDPDLYLPYWSNAIYARQTWRLADGSIVPGGAAAYVTQNTIAASSSATSAMRWSFNYDRHVCWMWSPTPGTLNFEGGIGGPVTGTYHIPIESMVTVAGGVDNLSFGAYSSGQTDVAFQSGRLEPKMGQQGCAAAALAIMALQRNDRTLRNYASSPGGYASFVALRARTGGLV